MDRQHRTDMPILWSNSNKYNQDFLAVRWMELPTLQDQR